MLEANAKEMNLRDFYLKHEGEIIEIQDLLRQAKWLSDTIYNHFVDMQVYKPSNGFDENARISNDILNTILLKLIDKVDNLDKSLNVIKD